MSTFVSEEVAQDFADNGLLIGRTQPSEETKFTWWKVYEKNGEYVACVFSDYGVSCGEKIQPHEFHLYMDTAAFEAPGHE